MSNISRRMLHDMNRTPGWPFRGRPRGRRLRQLMYTEAEARIAERMYAHQVRNPTH